MTACNNELGKGIKHLCRRVSPIYSGYPEIAREGEANNKNQNGMRRRYAVRSFVSRDLVKVWYPVDERLPTPKPGGPLSRRAKWLGMTKGNNIQKVSNKGKAIGSSS